MFYSGFREFIERWNATSDWFARSGLIHYLEQRKDLGFVTKRINFRVQAAGEILEAVNDRSEAVKIPFPDKLLKTLVENALRDILTWRQKYSNDAFDCMGTLLVQPELLARIEMNHKPLSELLHGFLSYPSLYGNPSWWVEAVIATECFDFLETKHASEAVPLMWRYLMKEVEIALCKEKFHSRENVALRNAPIRISSLAAGWGSYAHRYNPYGRAVSVRTQALVLFLAQCGIMDPTVTPPDHEVERLEEVLKANPLKVCHFY